MKKIYLKATVIKITGSSTVTIKNTHRSGKCQCPNKHSIAFITV